MPLININLSDDDYNRLLDEYKKMAIAWPRPGRAALPPTFEAWLGQRAAAAANDGNDAIAPSALDEMRVFSAIEKLITGLRPAGFCLAHLDGQATTPAESAWQVARGIVQDMHLTEAQLKRIQHLIEYYAQDVKEAADAAGVGVTGRVHHALHEAYRELVERTENAVGRLGEHRAIGRVEGAVAMLVSAQVMDRRAAQERTEAFKLQVRGQGK